MLQGQNVNKMIKPRNILLSLLALALLGAALFVIWAITGPGPQPEALSALNSDSLIKVEMDQWLIFRPAAGQPTTGLILYPGGRVDPRAYAPAARAIASKNYLVVIVPMPLNLAVLGSGLAADVTTTYPHIEHWAVGGHSLGGAMAAHFAAANPSLVQGLVLWAAYPAEGDDLSASSLAVTSVYGTLDGLATEAKIDGSRSLLPSETSWVAIQGGNHAQFGWYGPQAGDNPATVGRQEQTEQMVTATLALLERLALAQ